jgi:hypothetical protein
MKTALFPRPGPPLILALALLVSGCSTVFVRAPIGDKPHALDPAEWAGTWLTTDGKAVLVSVPDRAQGVLQLAGLEGDEHDLKLKKYTVYLTESAGWLFANLKGDSPETVGRFLWGRLKREDDHVMIWAPDVAAFEALVRDGKLKGKTPDSGDVELEPMPTEMLAALASGTLGVPFDWDEPFVLRRVSR